VARAADIGYNLVIILSGGNFNDLRGQTQSRLFTDLIDPVNNHSSSKKWHKATNIDRDKKVRGDVGDHLWDGDWDVSKNNCIVVSKKNADTLKKLKKWLQEEIMLRSQASNSPVNLLFIDDEADHASLNLTLSESQPDKESSRINELLREALHSIPNHVYIGFTASPFANTFVPPEIDRLKDSSGLHIPTLYPRDFIFLLPEPQGYFGLKEMCPTTEPKWTNHLHEVKEAEAIFYRKNTEKKGLKIGIKDGLKLEIFNFYISLGLRYFRSNQDLNFHHSMLIHTKETKKTMHGILETVRPYVVRFRETLFSKGMANETQKQLYKEFSNHYSSRCKVLTAPPSLEILIKNLADYLGRIECQNFPQVLEISSDEEKGDNLVYRRNEPYAVIAIGGNRLARGFTLEGLFSSYFVREPKTVKTDTLLQQGRWFGFRGENEDLVSIHTTESLRTHFWNVKLVVQDLHDTITHFQISGLDPRLYAVPIMKALGQIPTAKNKMPKFEKKLYNMLSGDYLPKRGSGFPINIGPQKTEHEQKNHDNSILLGDLIDTMVDLRGMPPRSKKGNYVFDDIPLPTIIDYFKETLGHFVGDPYNKSQLLEYLSTRRKNGNECSSWTVAIIGNKPGKSDLPIRFGTSSHSLDLNLVQRSRISKDTDDFRVFTQINDFAISSSDRSGATIKQHCGKRNAKNPILLVYLIDKKSKPSDPNSSRASLDTSDHIVTLAIGFPLAELTSYEVEKYNTEKWWNSQLKIET